MKIYYHLISNVFKMGASQSLIDQINRTYLLIQDKLDINGRDKKITIKEFENFFIESSDEEYELLCGKGKEKVADWAKFKEHFRARQAEYGISWKQTQGRGGVLTLDKVEFTREVGEQCAIIFLKSNRNSGNITEIILDEFSGLFGYLGVSSSHCP